MRYSTWIAFLGLFVCGTLGIAAPETGAAAGKTKVVERTVHVEVRVPDGVWRVVIQEIWRVGGELWVFARVERPADEVGAMMICTAMDDVKALLPDLPTRTFITGKKWRWTNTEEVEWVATDAPVFTKRREGMRVWRKPRE